MARAAAGLPAPRVTLVRSLTVENLDSSVILSLRIDHGFDLGGRIVDGVRDTAA
jgi:hypothetical protein